MPQRCGLRDGGFARVATAHGACVAEGRRQRRPAAGLAVRADPLERRHRLVGARRRSGRARTPIRIPASPRPRRRRRRSRRSHSRCAASCCTASPDRAAGRNLVGARRHRRRRTSTCSRPIDGPMIWHDFAYGMLSADAKLAEHLDGSADLSRRRHSSTASSTGCLFVGPAGRAAEHAAISPRSTSQDDGGARWHRSRPTSVVETGPVVCACFGVGVDCDPRRASHPARRRRRGDRHRRLRAGTNCGSCLPELKRMIAQSVQAHAPANTQTVHAQPV